MFISIKKILFYVVVIVCFIGNFLLLNMTLAYILTLGWEQVELKKLNSESKLIEIDKYNFEYKFNGTKGTVVILSHGSPGGFDQGDVFCTYVNTVTDTCIGVSRPGYLRTDLDLAQSPQQQAESFVKFLDTQNIAKAVVIATSGGGPAALQFAVNHQDRCAGLIMISAISKKWTGEISDPTFFQKFQDYLMQQDFILNLYVIIGTAYPQILVDTFIQNPDQRKMINSDKKIKMLIRAVHTVSLYSHRKAGVDNDFSYFKNLDIKNLNTITAPTLIMHGTADINVDISDSEYLANQIKQARFIKVKDAEHAMFITHEELITEHVQRFLTISVKD